MKQIKTITYRLNNSKDFDKEVNEAIKEGWTLIERKVLLMSAQPNDGRTYMHNMLYAELERFTEPDETEDSPLTNLIENLAALAGAMTRKAASLKEKKPVESVAPETALCETCKHGDKGFYEEPCYGCDGQEHWEPET